MKKHSYFLAAILSLLTVVSHANGLNDPELEFLSRLSREPNCLWRIEADLNSDQFPEVLLTLNDYRNGKAGHIWQVYLGTRNGFVRVNEPISFRADAGYIGHIPDIGKRGLLTYLPSSGSNGALVAYHVKDTELVRSDLGAIHPLGADAAKYKRFFGSSKLSVTKKSLNGGSCS